MNEESGTTIKEVKPKTIKKKPPVKDNKYKKTSVLKDVQLRLQKDESDHTKIAELLMNEKYKRRKTILSNNRQVGLITTLDVIAQLYDIPFLKEYVDNYAEYLTSIKGVGRKDIVDISKFAFEQKEKFNNQLLELANRRR